MKMYLAIALAIVSAIAAPSIGRAQEDTRPEPPALVPDTGVLEVVDTAVQQMPSLAVTKESAHHKLRVTLPAAYWEYKDLSDLLAESQGGGGCGAPTASVPEEVVFEARHRDAATAGVRCLHAAQTFLLRNEEDMEDFVDRRMDAVRMQLGEAATLVSREFVPSESGNPIVHRARFELPMRQAAGPGGCAPAQAPAADEAGPKVVVLVVDRFVRPKGGNIERYEVRVLALDKAWEQLESEIEMLLGSIRYTGELAQQFYEPDAPESSLPGAEAVEEGTKRPGTPPWLIAIFVVSLLWMLFRRRKPRQTEAA